MGCVVKGGLLAVLLLGGTLRPGEEVTRIHLEEGAFVNLPSYVDWHTEAGQGWYIKEHYHASGYAFAVCDEQSEGAKAYLRVRRELPPSPLRCVGEACAYEAWRCEPTSHSSWQRGRKGFQGSGERGGLLADEG